MIAQIAGVPVLTGDRWVVVDVHGVGYQVSVTQPALREIAAAQGPVRLFTHLAVREDALALYGFLRQSELEIFRILIGVSGIGPQTAMNLLSQISIGDFAIAILNEDEKALTRIAGIGPKSAKRLILELRDSLGATVVVVTHELASIFAIGNNSVFLDATEKTMIAGGNPTTLLHECQNETVHKFLTRGEGDHE